MLGWREPVEKRLQPLQRERRDRHVPPNGLIPQPRVNLRLDLEFDVFARRIGNGKSSVWKAPRDPPAPPYEGGERVWDCVGGRAGDVFGTASAWRCAGIASGLVSQVGLS